jgi:hypothetical protein
MTSPHADRVREPAAVGASCMCFLHIMKTGGTTISSMVADAWSDDDGPVFAGLFLDQLAGLRDAGVRTPCFISGHLPFEVTDWLPAHAVTVTVLRDPVDRVLSHFAQLQTNPEVRRECPRFDLDEFIESPRWATLVQNYQARQLAHRIGWATMDRPRAIARYTALGPPFPPTCELPMQSLFDCSPLDVDDEELRSAAVANLDQIGIVGVTEQLAAVAGAVLTTLDLPIATAVPQLNASVARPRRESLSGAQLALIEELNRVDTDLYRAALTRADLLERTKRAARDEAGDGESHGLGHRTRLEGHLE